ncbi:MAG: cytochrome c [Alphaproteobacteria bacterium]|nr:cytochrome c [Alphaproteobacteria bacterium]
MNSRALYMAGAVLALGAAIAYAQMGPGTMRGGMMQGGMMSSPRHFYYMHNGLPPEYAGKVNVLTPTPQVLARGRKLYADNCAACHGANGNGDGPAGRELNPPPADLSLTMSMPIARDDFLYWSIAEGGVQFGSAMPAFKTTLKPDDIWSIISALRSGDLQTK